MSSWPQRAGPRSGFPICGVERVMSEGSEFMVQGFGLRVQALGFRVQGRV